MKYYKKGEKTLPELIKLHQNGSIEARNIIIERYMPKAKEIASEFYGLGLDDEEVLACAYEGLILIVDKFKDLNHSELFTVITNLTLTLRRYLIKCIMTEYGFVEMNNKDQQMKLNCFRVLKAIKELTSQLKRKPSIKEISDYTDIEEYQVKEYLNYLERVKFKSIEEMTLEDYKDSINGVLDPEYNCIKEEILKDLKDILMTLNLKERESQVLELLTFDVELTMTEIGKILGLLTKQRIFQIEQSIIRKIKRRKDIMDFIEGISPELERGAVDTEIAYKRKHNRA